MTMMEPKYALSNTPAGRITLKTAPNAPPRLTGDQRRDWALWRLSLLVTEVAEAVLCQQRTGGDQGEPPGLAEAPDARERCVSRRIRSGADEW